MSAALALAPVATPSAVAIACGWAVVATHSQAEEWACANLRRMGYRTYLPLYAARVRDPVLKTMTRVVQRPLFASYAFVWLDGGIWQPIRSAYGVRTLLMNGENPGMVPEAAVEALQATEPFRRSPLPPGAVWAAGDPCKARQTACPDAHAVVVRIDGSQATIALMMLGQLREVRVPVECLIPRDE